MTWIPGAGGKRNETTISVNRRPTFPRQREKGTQDANGNGKRGFRRGKRRISA